MKTHILRKEGFYNSLLKKRIYVNLVLQAIEMFSENVFYEMKDPVLTSCNFWQKKKQI